MEESILQSKSFDLSVLVYRKVAELQKKQKDFLLSQWWFEAVSSVSLNMYLAQNIHTKTGFSVYLYTARKAAFKALFWNKLLFEAGELTEKEKDEVAEKLLELIKMLQAAIATLNNSRKSNKTSSKATE